MVVDSMKHCQRSRYYIAAEDSRSYCRLDQSDVGGLVGSRAAPWHPDVCVSRRRTESTCTVIETNQVVEPLSSPFYKCNTMFVHVALTMFSLDILEK